VKQNINKNLLNSYRFRYGESQEALAESLGMTQSQLSLRLNNKTRMTLPEASFIVARYGIPPEDAMSIFFR